MRTIYKDINLTHQNPSPIIVRNGETAARVYFRFPADMFSDVPGIVFYIGELEAVGVIVDDETCYVDISSNMTENIGEYSGNLVITDGADTVVSSTILVNVKEVA
jgi:hypothetical protein